MHPHVLATVEICLGIRGVVRPDRVDARIDDTQADLSRNRASKIIASGYCVGCLFARRVPVFVGSDGHTESLLVTHYL